MGHGCRCHRLNWLRVCHCVLAFVTLSYTWATDALSSLSVEHPSVVDEILQNIVKPLFRSNPHPSLNLSTGRTLPRPAGGPMASQDYYQSQTWKTHPGSANVVSWCVRKTNV